MDGRSRCILPAAAPPAAVLAGIHRNTLAIMKMHRALRHALAASALCALALAAPAGAQARHDYTTADSVARAVPQAATRDVATLAAHFRAALPDERDRARAIYRWLVENVAYDAALFFSGAIFPPAQDAESVLRRRRGVCEGFSALFAGLATQAGLPAAIVVGNAKAFDPDRPYRTQKHTWNAVRLEGEWRLVDASWGAGDILGREFVRRPREFFFDTPPAKLIWSHRPDDDRWQLLDQPLSAREFERLPFTHRDFWELGFPAQLVFDAVRADGFSGFAGVFTAPGHRVEILEAPLNGRLAAGQEHTFRLRAPGADTILVVSGESWQGLRREGDTFVGTASLSAPEMVVMIRYPDNPAGAIVLRYQSASAGTRRRGR
jgi:Transglutaminase-like superfamily